MIGFGVRTAFVADSLRMAPPEAEKGRTVEQSWYLTVGRTAGNPEAGMQTLHRFKVGAKQLRRLRFLSGSQAAFESRLAACVSRAVADENRRLQAEREADRRAWGVRQALSYFADADLKGGQPC